MKALNYLLTTIACLMAGFGSAVAADLRVKAPAPVAPTYLDSWNMLYLGLNGGWNLGSFSPFCRACGVTATEVNLDDNNPFVGGHIGYLYQGAGSILVIGVEGGIQYLGFKSQAQMLPAVGVTPEVLLQQKLDWLGYANIRVGLTPFPSTLLYVTGGFAWSHVKGQLINLATLDTVNAQSITGWNVGGGLEFKLGASGWSLGAEYRHYDFGDVQAINPLIATSLGVSTSRLTMEQVMGRLSYKLN